MNRTAAPVAATLACVAVLAGCTAGSGGQPQTAEPTRSDAAPSQAVAAPEPSPSPSSAHRAADGRDVAACFDGDCEIAVEKSTTIPLDPKFDLGELVVDEVGPNSVKVTRGDGYFSMTVGAGGATAGEDGVLLAYTLVAVTGTEAIIRFWPAG